LNCLAFQKFCAKDKSISTRPLDWWWDEYRKYRVAQKEKAMQMEKARIAATLNSPVGHNSALIFLGWGELVGMCANHRPGTAKCEWITASNSSAGCMTNCWDSKMAEEKCANRNIVCNPMPSNNGSMVAVESYGEQASAVDTPFTYALGREEFKELYNCHAADERLDVKGNWIST
jgi:hypothetical protein